MKIAFVLPSLANKGPIILAKELVTYLINHGHHCDVYYFDEIVELDFPCKTIRISFFKSFNYNSYEIIHSHMFRPDLYCTLNKWRFGKSLKLISTVHTSIYHDLRYTYGSLKSGLIIPFWKRAMVSMDHIVVLTETAKRYYADARFRGITVINNGREIPEFSEPIPERDLIIIEELKKDHILLGTVCLVDRRKGLEQIIKLLAREKSYAFIVVGDGNERHHLEHKAVKYGVSDRFKVIGARENGYRYLSFLDLFMIPSRSEGMPLAMLEAMALKVPIVCSNIPAFKEEYNEEELSFFDLDDVESLRKTCSFALNRRKIMSHSAYQHYKSKYTVDIMGNNYIKLYNYLANQ